jgi:AcrR family transcriptional regulator
VVETVLRMLEEGATIAELSIERIARGAGVGKATLYRRWPGKNALMLDVIQRLEVPDPPFPGTSLRADLITAVESVRRRGLAKRSSALLRNVLAQAQQDPELWRAYYEGAIAARRAQLRAALVRGIERGEITTGLDLDMLGDMVSGPMLYRAMMRPEAPLDDEGLAARIVDALLDGLRPRAD